MKERKIARIALRVSLALIGLFLCVCLVIGSVRFGVARLFSAVAIVQSGVEPTDTAVKFGPNDPEAHYTRGLALVNAQRVPEAITELQQAIRLRPHHYYQWLDLGVTLQRSGNETDATTALKESIRLAPSFAQPHWQLGNLLFREERYQEAFDELRRGAKSSPNLFGGMLDLAWVASDGDVGGFERLIQAAGSRNHLEAARFLAKRGKGSDSARHVREASPTQDEQERDVIVETITELLVQGSFSEAFDVWVLSHPNASAGKGQILNGDFLDPITEKDPGFGWQVPKVANVSVEIDPAGPSPKSRSLRIEFSGESPPLSQVVYQMVLLERSVHYSLSFSAKTEQLVSGGPAVMVVSDPDFRAPKTLAQSKPIPTGTSDWNSYTLEFDTSPTTSGVVIGLQRTACSQTPCPVFGKLWLGRLTLNRN